MIKQLSERSALVRPSRLTAIHRVESLVEEETDCPGEVYPWWTVGIKSGIIPEESEKIGDNKAEAGECDLV